MAINNVTGESLDGSGTTVIATAMRGGFMVRDFDAATSSVEADKDDVTEYMYRPDLCAAADASSPHSSTNAAQRNRGSNMDKVVFYFSAIFFWALSFLTVALGLYLYYARTVPVLVILKVHVDPSSILIVCGLTAFMLTNCGFVGALRENICLLKVFAFGLLILVAIQTAFLVLIFLVLYTNINITINPSYMLQKAIVLYSEDESMRDLIDFLQINFHCCGVGDDGYLEWNLNPYFNCSTPNQSVQRCGVPFSCCKILEGEPANTLCGSDTTNDTMNLFQVQHRIFTDGCVHAVGRLLYENALLTGANVFGTTVLMFIGVFAAMRMAAQLQRNRDYHMLSLQTTALTRL